MLTEIVTELAGVVFVLGLPIYLAVEEIVHRLRGPEKVGSGLELRRPRRETVLPDRAARAA